MKDITCVYIADGYLAYVAPTDEVWGDGYWPHGTADEEGFTTAELRVSDDLADKLCRQGSSDQHFADGYEAASAVAAYCREPVTDVMFRVSKSEPDDVYALFPGIAATAGKPWECLSYQHVGQHSAAALTDCVYRSRPATEEESAPLMRELERIGYRLRVVQRQTNKHSRARVEQLQTGRGAALSLGQK